MSKVNLMQEKERATVMGFDLYQNELKLKYPDEMHLLVAYHIMDESNIEEYLELTVNHDAYELVLNLFF